MQDEFLPLYGVLIAGSLVSAALAIRWIVKLREGSLHLLDRAGPDPEPEEFIQVPRPPRPRPEPPPEEPSALVAE